MIAVSVVSHGHGGMVSRLVAQLAACPEVAQIIVTLNIPETLPALSSNKVEMVANDGPPRGFGANHNAAFDRCRQPYFCPVNPDIELLGNPFPALLASLVEHDADLAAPLVISPSGQIEDYARRFPTVSRLLGKLFGGDGGCYAIRPADAVFYPEWLAGMFMLFRSKSFAELGGFDEGFFLYYEDVDLCVRAWKAGMRLLTRPDVSVIHDARRESRRKLKYLRWHLASMLRYFSKHLGRLPVVPQVR